MSPTRLLAFTDDNLGNSLVLCHLGDRIGHIDVLNPEKFTFKFLTELFAGFDMQTFRLIQEPKRLWKRYIIGIPYFVYLIIKQKMAKS